MKRVSNSRGFTLLEVIIAGGLLAVLTAAAMGAYVAQVKLLNTQQQTSQSLDHIQEAIRLIGNDLRAAAPGVSSSATGPCQALGTIPYDMGGAAGVACLPPVFRSTYPLFYNTAAGSPYAGASCGGPASPGYKLQLGANSGGFIYEPNALPPGGSLSNTGAPYFCPDDLVIVAVDDSNPFFLASTPVAGSNGNASPLTFYGSNPAVSYGFDTMMPTGGGVLPLGGDLFLLQGAGQGASLLYVGAAGTVPINPTQALQAAGSCAGGPDCYASYSMVLSTPTVDLFGGAQPGAVGLPARITEYAIEPVGADGSNTPPFVSANLVRNSVLPMAPVGAGFAFQPASPQLITTVLVKGVLDMQVEFGIENPPGSGQLQYVSSIGAQSINWNGLPATLPTVTVDATPSNYVFAAAGGSPLASSQGVYPGVAFPTNQNNAYQNLRSVRFTLLVRESTIANSRTSQAGLQSSAGTSAPFMMQAAVQDVVSGGAIGNLEAQNWAGNGATLPAISFPTVDGAEYK
ncbi:MAG TPA: type II secretion system protein, partial [Myxococcales bacterium]|nr:type II secretion system protein [Myxococcales bacterium]